MEYSALPDTNGPRRIPGTVTGPQLKYLERALETATPEELIVKIYDGLVLFSRQAVERMTTEPGDIQGRHDLLRRAQRACALLMGSLRFDVDPELCANLFAIYRHWHQQLVRANMTADVTLVEALLPTFAEYRETWAEAILQHRQAERAPVAGSFVAVS